MRIALEYAQPAWLEVNAKFRPVLADAIKLLRDGTLKIPFVTVVRPELCL